MKFGETLHQRSVPKWASYNLNYNELKRLIKLRTTQGAPSPRPIPGQTDHRWSLLEDELYAILKDQHDNIALFLRSKYGEIERRLAYLDKSVRSAKRSARLYAGRPTLQARKYQKLIQEAESIGEDIQALSRFAAVQKTAFRKILKKYRKWTDSSTLQQRFQDDVLSSQQLDLNLSEQMQHLSAQESTIHDLEFDLLRPGEQLDPRRASTVKVESPIAQITRAIQSGPLHFDAAVASVPFGEAAGTASYWIHPDSLDEARVLLLRYMKDINIQSSLSRESSAETLTNTSSIARPETRTSTCYLDNLYRFAQDTTASSPSRIAMCARWSNFKEALVTMSDMSPRSDSRSTIPVKRKDLPSALERDSATSVDRSANAANINIVREFLSQHRDLKPLTHQSSVRVRFAGLNNSSEVSTYAVLDTDVNFRPLLYNEMLDPEASSAKKVNFPHAILQIRWEFGRKPEVVRSFDTTHLAERVPNFSLESAAVHSQHPDQLRPSWSSLLSKDIRKIPVQKRAARRQESITGTISAPSSTGESVFSVTAEPSIGSETSPVASTQDLAVYQTTSKPDRKAGRKKARIVAQSPGRKQARYYSEYDDPDSELHDQEAYTIFVDPNAEAPGIETLRRLGSALSNIFSYPWSRNKANPGERDPLLPERWSGEEQSSESDSEPNPGVPKHKGLHGRIRPAQRYRMRLSRRQRAFERTLAQMYSGLIVISYVFLLLSGTLLATGRKKEIVEVDVGATVGLVVAMLCMVISVVFVYMRKEKLGRVETISLWLADGMVVLFGFAILVGIVQRATNVKKH